MVSLSRDLCSLKTVLETKSSILRLETTLAFEVIFPFSLSKVSGAWEGKPPHQLHVCIASSRAAYIPGSPITLIRHISPTPFHCRVHCAPGDIWQNGAKGADLATVLVW